MLCLCCFFFVCFTCWHLSCSHKINLFDLIDSFSIRFLVHFVVVKCELVDPDWNWISKLPKFRVRFRYFLREGKHAKNHFQQNHYSVFESHVMRKESVSTKILRSHSNSVMGIASIVGVARCRER